MNDLTGLGASLRHQIVDLRVTGGNEELVGSCPFHTNRGVERNPSFYINQQNGYFYCHSCKESGTLQRLLRWLGLPRDQIDSVISIYRGEWDRRKRLRDIREQHQDPFRGAYLLNEAILGIYEYCPVDLITQGFEEELLREHEIGFDAVRERIIFPLRDLYGNLVGLSGRSASPHVRPRYKVYLEELRDVYPGYRIDKSGLLWNMDRLYPGLLREGGDLIVVEGFKACLWVKQSGLGQVVGAMGSYLSKVQKRILQRIRGNITLFFDNDPAGFIGTFKGAPDLTKTGCRVLVAQYPSEELRQPDDMHPDLVKEVVETAIPYRDWLSANQQTLSRFRQNARRTDHGQNGKPR